jgi:hypothetical protein
MQTRFDRTNTADASSDSAAVVGYTAQMARPCGLERDACTERRCVPSFQELSMLDGTSCRIIKC